MLQNVCGAAVAAALSMLLLVTAPPGAAAATTPACAFSGFTGKLSNLEHNVAGTVTVNNCSSVTVDGFTYDGAAPAAYWWCAKSSSRADLLAGFRAAPARLTRAYNEEKVQVALVPQADFSTNCRVLAVWCEQFAANFGDVTITPAAKKAPPAAPRATTGAATPACANGGFSGFEGDLSTLEHQVAGRVRIGPDCGVSVKGFTYDGAAPAAHWWCAKSNSRADLLAGFRAAPARLTRAYNGEQVSVPIVPNANLSGNCRILAVWCEVFKADFGHVVLGAPAKTTAGSAAVTASPTDVTRAGGNPTMKMTSVLPAGPTYCRELLSGSLQIVWPKSVAGSKTINATLIASGLPPRSWMAFGFADPAKKRSAMIGSDVVVAGILPSGEPFAVDYYLGSHEQCNYASGANKGVCPDAGLLGVPPGSPAANNVKLLAAKKEGGVISVTFSRPAAASDRFDRDWPTGPSPAFVVFATGPLAEGSTVAQPAVLYHGPVNHSPEVPVSLQFSFGTPSTCTKPLTAAPTSASAGTGLLPAPEGARQPVATLSGVTAFDVTIGTNLNYPNPPGWGLSYWINGRESPVLRVLRGTTYTFKIKAGETHPLYLTSSSIGGNANATEVVYAGGEAAHGTASKPYLLKWTPDAKTPTVIYYGCYEHQKLGWRIEVSDPPGAKAKSGAPATSSAQGGRKLLGAAAVAAAAAAGLVR